MTPSALPTTMSQCPSCRGQCFPGDAVCEDCGCPLLDTKARDAFLNAAMFTVYRVIDNNVTLVPELVEGRAHEAEARGIAYHQRTMARAKPSVPPVLAIIVRKRGVVEPILTLDVAE